MSVPFDAIDPPRWVDESLSEPYVTCRGCGLVYEWDETDDDPHECQNCDERLCECRCPMPGAEGDLE